MSKSYKYSLLQTVAQGTFVHVHINNIQSAMNILYISMLQSTSSPLSNIGEFDWMHSLKMIGFKMLSFFIFTCGRLFYLKKHCIQELFIRSVQSLPGNQTQDFFLTTVAPLSATTLELTRPVKLF